MDPPGHFRNTLGVGFWPPERVSGAEAPALCHLFWLPLDTHRACPCPCSATSAQLPPRPGIPNVPCWPHTGPWEETGSWQCFWTRLSGSFLNSVPRDESPAKGVSGMVIRPWPRGLQEPPAGASARSLPPCGSAGACAGRCPGGSPCHRPGRCRASHLCASGGAH